ncbi:MAG: hypothetical protein JNK04_04075 [Myxococcales bacterium]|nr:hypothetical protein [Myxococcales bacterium]
MTRLLLWLPAIGVSALGGCDSADAASAPSAAPSAARTFDMGAYCSAVCERATACGIEALEQTVKANAADVGVLNKARAQSADTTASCERTCNAPVPDDQREALADAQRCLDQTTCPAFAGCLDTVAKR